MSAPFTASAEDVQALATFLSELTDLSNKTGVWICTYDRTAVTLPNGSTIEINHIPGKELEPGRYVVDTVTGY